MNEIEKPEPEKAKRNNLVVSMPENVTPIIKRFNDMGINIRAKVKRFFYDNVAELNALEEKLKEK